VPFRGREIPIVQLGLEEDSCREVGDVGHRRTYITDRLGMPLIETVTAPAMRTPQEVAEVGDLLRRIVRSTGRVRTGMGAARQDVNVSVTGGTRIEIKGVPRLRATPLLTYNEAMRQWNLLRLMEELHRRGITEGSFGASTDEVTRLLRKTRYQPVSSALEAGAVVQCVTLRGFRGLLRWPTQTGTVFSREISDRVRVIACLTTLPNIIHSDSTSETLSTSEWQSIRKGVGASDEDVCVLVWGDAGDTATGAREITIRAKEAAIGVPSETRQALRDGTNGFERILPGPDRMYPDTDLPPKRITAERLGRLRAMLPPLIWKLETWYEELGVPPDVIRPLATSPYAGLFERAVKEWGLSPVAAGVALIQWTKRFRRSGVMPDVPSPEIMERLLFAHSTGELTREGVYEAMRRLSREGGDVHQAMPVRCTEPEIGETIRIVDGELAQMTVRKPARREQLRMGMIMNRLRGRADGSGVARMAHQGS
jgi:glutamyl-tRNA(Gln) amidotransferase subunit E